MILYYVQCGDVKIKTYAKNPRSAAQVVLNMDGLGPFVVVSENASIVNNGEDDIYFSVDSLNECIEMRLV
jgi:hypothetical protein